MTGREKFEAWFMSEDQAELRKSCAAGWAFIIWQTALASQQPSDDGWIEWSGGDCPVDQWEMVAVKHRSDNYLSQIRPAFKYIWEHSGWSPSADIIAYRVVKP